MNAELKTEEITCPCCDDDNNDMWAKENGYTAVKCKTCGLVYVNPRPSASMISEAVKTGVHRELENEKIVISRRVGKNVTLYKAILTEMFPDIWGRAKPVSWLDVGAGYGEFVEAVTALSSQGSNIEGLEPMKPKADDAKRRNLKVREAYISEINEKYDFVSLINVFSHIPDFHHFLDDIKKILKPSGEFFLETGNIGDISNVKEVPTELHLPDHLVFAGEKTIERFLKNTGFSIVAIKYKRKDTITNLLKNIVKKILGRKVTLALPYSSPFRTMFIRAKLN